MGKDSAIAWTDHTFNPWWGCARVSPGCENCYAETFSARVGHGVRLPQIWGAAAERKPMSEAYWKGPLKWNRDAERDGIRRRVFCASMADVFEVWRDGREAFPEERGFAASEVRMTARARLWPLIEATPHLDWLLLTKRPENVAALAPWGHAWPTNVWLGVTAEDQRRADARIPILLNIPAKVRFVSAEPLLESIDLSRLGLVKPANPEGVHWVIVGGESGPGARPFEIGWARRVVTQCRREGTAVFVKQLGSRPYANVSERIHGMGGVRLALVDRKGGDPSEWPPELRVQQWPEAAS